MPTQPTVTTGTDKRTDNLVGGSIANCYLVKVPAGCPEIVFLEIRFAVHVRKAGMQRWLRDMTAESEPGQSERSGSVTQRKFQHIPWMLGDTRVYRVQRPSVSGSRRIKTETA